ncbi:MAG TPA: hypothetical protein VGC66_01435 [Pyrinomonadaceae bacterium]
MSQMLLTYAVLTTPDPLQASPQTGDPSLATLMIVVSNNTHQLIDCQSLSFSFLQGTDAKDFFSDSTGIGTSAPAGWSITQDGALFTATPDTSADGKVGAAGLTFVLTNIKVNEQPGTTNMTITEVTSSNTGTLSYPLAKFPPQFFVGQLQANPVNVVEGASTTLSWSGSSGANYEIQYQDVDGNTVTIAHPKNEPDQPLPSTGSYTVDDLQADPTVFTLIVTLQVDGESSSLQVQRQFVVAVSQLTLNFQAMPTTVGMNGVTQLIWQTTRATSCILDPGNQSVPTNGQQYVLIQTDSIAYTLTAYGNAGLSKQAQITVSVDPTIVPTDIINAVGANGMPGEPGPQGASGYPGGDGSNGGDGVSGNDFTRNCTLDQSSKPATVWLIEASGGAGGPGGTGGNGDGGGSGGNGGNGGDGGTITLIFDPEADTPAGYIVVSNGGSRGAKGQGGAGNPPGNPGNPGNPGKPGQIILKEASD